MSAEHAAEFNELFPVPDSARRVVVFGGTFDPPHAAHVELPEAARAGLGADWVLYIPAARSPHRERGPIASARDRLAMLRLALAGRERCSVSPIELVASEDMFGADPSGAGDGSALPPPSYTVDTLRKLRVLAPPTTEMRLLIGADQASAFHRWRQAREVIALAEPVVMLRAPSETPEALMAQLRPNWSADEAAKWRARIIALPTMDVSATAVREALARGGADDPIAAVMLDRRVRRYIQERGVYRRAV